MDVPPHLRTLLIALVAVPAIGVLAPPAPATPRAPAARPVAVAAPAGMRPIATGAVPARVDRLAEARLRTAQPDHTRSLIYSGAVALSVSLTGLALVSWRRRQW